MFEKGNMFDVLFIFVFLELQQFDLFCINGGGVCFWIGEVVYGGKCVVLFGKVCVGVVGVGVVFDFGVSKIVVL